MKKISLTMICVALCTLFTACSDTDGTYMFFDYDKKTSDRYIKSVLNVLETKNGEELKSLFANNCLKEMEVFDLSTEELFDYFEGEIISYNDWGGGEVDSIKEYIRYYNNDRISTKLKGMSPVQYRTHSKAN